jgi:hypothetical protein
MCSRHASLSLLISRQPMYSTIIVKSGTMHRSSFSIITNWFVRVCKVAVAVINPATKVVKIFRLDHILSTICLCRACSSLKSSLTFSSTSRKFIRSNKHHDSLIFKYFLVRVNQVKQNLHIIRRIRLPCCRVLGLQFFSCQPRL